MDSEASDAYGLTPSSSALEKPPDTLPKLQASTENSDSTSATSRASSTGANTGHTGIRPHSKQHDNQPDADALTKKTDGKPGKENQENQFTRKQITESETQFFDVVRMRMTEVRLAEKRIVGVYVCV